MGVLSGGYEKGEKIGKGGFGTVYKAISKTTGRTVAMKELDPDKFPDRIEEEITALANLRHRNIIHYIESFYDGRYRYIVMEYCVHGDLRSYLRRHGALSDKEAANVLYQLIEAVSYMHRHRTMHRDLSTGNVLISHITHDGDDNEERLEVKITDFGLVTVLGPGPKAVAASVVGTPGFVAPQVYMENYSKEADVYSLGAILYSMTSGKAPPDIRPSPRGEPSAELDLRSHSPEAADLIERMMCKDSKRRIQLNEIMTSAFMRQYIEPGLNRRNSSRSRDQPSKDSGNGSLPLKGSSDRVHRNECRDPTWYAKEPLVERKQMARRAESKERDECVGRGQPLPARRPPTSASTSCRHSRADQHNGQCPACDHRAFPPTERSRCPSLLNTGRCGGACQLAQRRRSLERGDERRSRERSLVGASNVGAPTHSTNLPWPLPIDRLVPFTHSWITGRYHFMVDQSVVGEFINRRGVVSLIMVVRPAAQGGQMVTTCKPSRAVRIDDHSTEMVASDYSTEKRFRSLRDLSPDLLSLYKRIVAFVNYVGSRVVKLRHYPVQFPGAVCNVMENGDFQLRLKDGRKALQKANDQLVNVTTQGDAEASLTEIELNLFRILRTDLLAFSRYAEDRSPALLPLVSGTPSPSPGRSPHSATLATKDRQGSTPLSRPAAARSSSASARLRRTNSALGKENVAPPNSNRDQIKIERTNTGSLAWLRHTGTGNRARLSQHDKRTLVYRLANERVDQRLKVDEGLPRDAEQMLEFMLKMADEKTA